MLLNRETNSFIPGKNLFVNEHLDEGVRSSKQIPIEHLVLQCKETQHILNTPRSTRPSFSPVYAPDEIDTPLIIHETSPSTASSSKVELVYDSNTDEDDHCAEKVLNNMRLKNLNKLIIGHLNINSIRGKFEALKVVVKNNLDILVVSETKLDHTFPDNQFRMDGYRLIRQDRKINGQYGGGVIVFIREDIPCKELKFQANKEIEGIFFEINLRSTKWLFMSGYNPKKENIACFLKYISQGIDKYLCNYDNLLLIGDFNSEIDEKAISEFCDLYTLKSLINEPTCFKNSNNPTCIDLILTNREKHFQNSTTIESGLSDFHKMIVTVLKANFKKMSPIFIKYRNYSKFNDEYFRLELSNELLLNYDCVNITYEEFQRIFMGVLNKHAPLKTKIIRANNAPFMNKNMRKLVMNRSRLKNKFNKEPSLENERAYKKQRNVCVNLFRKAKKDYSSSLNPSVVADNKKFWMAIKPLFSQKVKIRNKIILIEGENIFSEDKEVADNLNSFFINTVKNLGIQGYDNTNDFIVNEANSPIVNIIDKFKNHPSILKIKDKIKITPNDTFSFVIMDVNDVTNKIKTLKEKTSSPDDIPVKILKTCCNVVSP